MFFANKKGFTFTEMLVVMSIIGFISSSASTSLLALRDSGQDTVRINDIQQLALAMEVSRDIFDDTYQVISNTTPQAVGTELPEVPENNSENDGIYGWIDNSSDSTQYCAFAVLEQDNDFGDYYVATPRGAGFMDERPVDFDSCAFYEEKSFDTGTENLSDKADVCHVNKKGKQKTLNVSRNALQAHLNHGDTEGPCE